MRCLTRTALLFALGLTHCSLGPSASQKTEAEKLSRAIDALRQAPNAEKSQLFAQLQSAACAEPDLCELKRLCTAGYALHVNGLSQTDSAKRMLAHGGAEAEAQASLALDAAKSSLAQAEPQIAHCADAEGAVHRKYKF